MPAAASRLLKKKVADSGQAVAFRNLKVVEAKTPKAEERNPVKSSLAEPVKNTARASVETKTSAQEAKLLIETAEPETIVEEVPEYATVESIAQPKTQNARPETVAQAGLLQNIRKQIANRQNGNGEPKAIPLTDERLQASWKNFSQQLKENKNPAAQSFDMARLRIIDSSVFEVISNNNLEQKFIEQERRNLSEYLVAEFNNRSLLFSIIVDENATVQEPVERTLTARDQYLEIIKQYPLVKELKDRLRMELDY